MRSTKIMVALHYCWTVVMYKNLRITVTVTIQHYSCCLLTFPVVRSTFTLFVFEMYGSTCRCLFSEILWLAATNRQTDITGTCTAFMLLTCKTSEGKEFSHVVPWGACEEDPLALQRNASWGSSHYRGLLSRDDTAHPNFKDPARRSLM